MRTSSVWFATAKGTARRLSSVFDGRNGANIHRSPSVDPSSAKKKKKKKKKNSMADWRRSGRRRRSAICARFPSPSRTTPTMCASTRAASPVVAIGRPSLARSTPAPVSRHCLAHMSLRVVDVGEDEMRPRFSPRSGALGLACAIRRILIAPRPPSSKPPSSPAACICCRATRSNGRLRRSKLWSERRPERTSERPGTGCAASSTPTSPRSTLRHPVDRTVRL